MIAITVFFLFGIHVIIQLKNEWNLNSVHLGIVSEGWMFDAKLLNSNFFLKSCGSVRENSPSIFLMGQLRVFLAKPFWDRVVLSTRLDA